MSNIRYYMFVTADDTFRVELSLDVDKCMELLSVAIPGYKHDDMSMVQSAYEYFDGKWDDTEGEDALLKWFAKRCATKAVSCRSDYLDDIYESIDGYTMPLKDYVNFMLVRTPCMPEANDWIEV